MQLPFSKEAFFAVFANYNESLWPAQYLLAAMALAAVVLALRRRGQASGRIIAGILAFLWAWIGLAYHVAFFAAINPLAYAFAALSLAGALTFAWQGVVQGRLQFRLRRTPRAYAGLAFIAYALLLYPAWSWLGGHRYPAMPTFGLPCPVTLFTIGLLCLLEGPYPRSVFLAPVAWSLIGLQAAFLLDVHQDLALLPAAIAGVMLAIHGNPNPPPPEIGSAASMDAEGAE